MCIRDRIITVKTAQSLLEFTFSKVSTGEEQSSTYLLQPWAVAYATMDGGVAGLRRMDAAGPVPVFVLRNNFDARIKRLTVKVSWTFWLVLLVHTSPLPPSRLVWLRVCLVIV